METIRLKVNVKVKVSFTTEVVVADPKPRIHNPVAVKLPSIVRQMRAKKALRSFINGGKKR